MTDLRRRAVLMILGAISTGGVRAANAPAAQRIVSVGGALTEMIYALHADASLVGVDTTSLYPAIARTLPSVGYARALSAEGVLSLAPTLIVATEDAGPPNVLRQISAAGVPLTILAANHRFDGMLDRLARVGTITGRVTEEGALAERLRIEWAAAQAGVAVRMPRPPRVLFVLSHTISQVMVAGHDTGAQAMIDYAGGVNALSAVAGYKPLTPEAAIAAAPDVILVTEQGVEAAGGIDGLLKLRGLAETPAGRARRVVALEAMLLLGFGPRMPTALRQLHEALGAA